MKFGRTFYCVTMRIVFGLMPTSRRCCQSHRSLKPGYKWLTLDQGLTDHTPLSTERVALSSVISNCSTVYHGVMPSGVVVGEGGFGGPLNRVVRAHMVLKSGAGVSNERRETVRIR